MTQHNIEQATRCLNCKNPSCKNGCPIGFDIPQFLQCVKAKNYALATQTVGHIFGEICGYICAKENQCKGHCILQKKGCGIDVGFVERQVFESNFPTISATDNAFDGVKAVVVGGGVSGVTFAAECIRHGAEVTIMEPNDLLYTLDSIPDFRLPKAALQRIKNAVSASKIKVEKHRVAACDLPQLQQQFDVVYFAVGVGVARALGVGGESYVTSADDFLRKDFVGKAIIIGGGNTAMDCARKNARRGMETVVAYRRTLQDMPAFPAEISAAQNENVRFMFNLAPLSVQKRDGHLVVKFAKTQSQGRGSLTVTDETTEIACDVVVACLGNTLDKSAFAAERFVPVDENGCVGGNLYAGGDAIGHSLAVQAVVDALKACRAIGAKLNK